MDENITLEEKMRHENRVLKAHQLHRLSQAYTALDKCDESRYIGSGITIEIKNINFEDFILADEFAIRDGLSQETIDALKKDIKRSFDLAINHPINSVLNNLNKKS